MDVKTIVAQLRALEGLLPADGWGEHYVIAVREAADLLDPERSEINGD